MKTSSSLARTLRVLFGLIRIVTLVGLCTTPILLTPLPIIDTTGIVSFRTDSKHLPTTNDLGGTGTRFDVKQLDAKISIYPGSSMPSDLETLRRETVVPANAVALLIWFLISHFLWQLFRRLEKGEIFTAENLKLVRKIGIAIIAGSFVEAAARVWAYIRFSTFVNHHLTIAGLTVQHSALSQFDGRFLLTGLVVLVVAEVFRQGLTLRQDSDLTV